MGIPSYYKRLIDRYPKLVQKDIKQLRSDVLLMDFNCLIYQCVRDASLPVYTAATKDEWEKALIEAVKKYTVKVWETAGRPAKVLIAVDGVVPMAKIRQQRLRRFKSRWLAAAEMGAGVRKEESWDTNAITPGTEFMEKLFCSPTWLSNSPKHGMSCTDF
jgi:5'-3' exoribonuclease 1